MDVKINRRHLDYEALVKSPNHRDAIQWCMNQFGHRWCPIDNRSGRWTVFWTGTNTSNNYKFHFAEERDMIWFKLRWQ